MSSPAANSFPPKPQLSSPKLMACACWSYAPHLRPNEEKRLKAAAVQKRAQKCTTTVISEASWTAPAPCGFSSATRDDADEFDFVAFTHDARIPLIAMQRQAVVLYQQCGWDQIQFAHQGSDRGCFAHEMGFAV